MHVLITSDTVGGVWTYTQELVTGLVQRGHRITLVSLGKLPLRHQTAWMKTLPGVDYRPTEYRLEWMEVAERDIEESKRYLELLISEVEPDVLHFSQYCYGSLGVKLPKIVVAHSDIVSWWVAVHGCEPEDTPWMRNYRETVSSGLRGADAVIAPSAWMLDQVAKFYFKPPSSLVIYNGRTPEFFDPNRTKEDFVLCVGRVWDPAKGISLLLERELELPVRVVGWEREPGREDRKRNLHVPKNVQLLGQRSQEQLRDLYARAGIYVATSRYEPFGLSPLEAAFSRCPLVLNANPVFDELWEGAGLFFANNNIDDLARALAQLRENTAMRGMYAERAYEVACDRFTAARMAQQYEQVYTEITSLAKVA
jgi:glycosyltransferase involved in cell wall biosynthesis